MFSCQTLALYRQKQGTHIKQRNPQKIISDQIKRKNVKVSKSSAPNSNDCKTGCLVLFRSLLSHRGLNMGPPRMCRVVWDCRRHRLVPVHSVDWNLRNLEPVWPMISVMITGLFLSSFCSLGISSCQVRLCSHMIFFPIIKCYLEEKWQTDVWYVAWLQTRKCFKSEYCETNTAQMERGPGCGDVMLCA